MSLNLQKMAFAFREWIASPAGQRGETKTRPSQLVADFWDAAKKEEDPFDFAEALLQTTRLRIFPDEEDPNHLLLLFAEHAGDRGEHGAAEGAIFFDLAYVIASSPATEEALAVLIRRVHGFRSGELGEEDVYVDENPFVGSSLSSPEPLSRMDRMGRALGDGS